MMNTESSFLLHPTAATITEHFSTRSKARSDIGFLAFVPEDLKAIVPQLQQCACAADVALAGAIFPELIFESRFRRDGILLLQLDPMPDYRLLGGLDAEQGWQPAVDELTAMVDGLPEEGTLLLLFDGLFGKIGSMLDDLHYELGDCCHYVGACVGSETFQAMPCLFDRERLLGQGVLGIGLPSHLGSTQNHSYEIPNETFMASAAAHNRISQIDWQPAFDKYAELIRDTYGETVTKENFYSMGVHFPFALHRIDGEMLIRIPVAVDDDGALLCVGEIPEGAMLNVARAVVPGSPDTVARLAADRKESQLASGIHFYCAGRRLHLGAAADQELAQLAAAIQPQQLAGALSLGEIGTSPGGYPLFHNATIIALPLG